MLVIPTKCKNIDHDEDTKEFEVLFSLNNFDRTEVEASAISTLQFSTSS